MCGSEEFFFKLFVCNKNRRFPPTTNPEKLAIIGFLEKTEKTKKPAIITLNQIRNYLPLYPTVGTILILALVNLQNILGRKLPTNNLQKLEYIYIIQEKKITKSRKNCKKM